MAMVALVIGGLAGGIAGAALFLGSDEEATSTPQAPIVSEPAPSETTKSNGSRVNRIVNAPTDSQRKDVTREGAETPEVVVRPHVKRRKPVRSSRRTNRKEKPVEVETKPPPLKDKNVTVNPFDRGSGSQ